MRIDDPGRSWPLLTLDRDAVEHNVATVAEVMASRGVDHAPHVKTHLSRGLWERQAAAGAWGATVATPTQLATVLGWGVRRAFLANELVDPRDAAWLRGVLDDDGADEVWVYVDSAHGVRTLAAAFDGAPHDRLGVLVELGVPGGRTGVRGVDAAVALAHDLVAAGLRLVGVAGYEGPAASGPDPRAGVARWCADLLAAADGLRASIDGPVVVSAGGSAFADVVLDALADRAGVRAVLRSGAYVTHDHGHYLRADPWTRLGAEALRPAITVWASVLSAPEPGRAVCAMGRRDVSFDIDLPFPLRVHPVDAAGRLGPGRPVTATVTALDDQHAYLEVPDDDLAPGEVVAFGVSHPCTTLDKHRSGLLVDGPEVVAELALEL
ncbi:D-serine deaminase-like pyridoxal phosphate-dependent protein [Isoptericola jiangsuensis]|uniref:D-serine deaminase-like pyridoxal phosphate-dependent protein n=1 Tax=Isoptericola jiangsuensis TaxID=548579 RepID=A0A2A9EU64_9MICO|nr:alanine racemase [Isoptericola jiangsuensis]PFG42564.1 D-serine deaminase-like pyridoxal phosphate-dependent protein [Isoptericola jiangsuensis]